MISQNIKAPDYGVIHEALQRLWEQCKARENDTDVFSLDASGNPRRNGQLFGIDRATYDMWKANAGDARARRRWRRRNIPNTQRLEARRAWMAEGL